MHQEQRRCRHPLKNNGKAKTKERGAPPGAEAIWCTYVYMGMDILRVGGFPAGPEGMPHSKHWSGWMEKQGNRIENPLAG